MAKKPIHVEPSGESWRVITSGSSKPLKVCDSQKDAIEIATKIAKRRKTTLIVKRPDGSIRSKDSFGADPWPPSRS